MDFVGFQRAVQQKVNSLAQLLFHKVRREGGGREGGREGEGREGGREGGGREGGGKGGREGGKCKARRGVGGFPLFRTLFVGGSLSPLGIPPRYICWLESASFDYCSKYPPSFSNSD